MPVLDIVRRRAAALSVNHRFTRHSKVVAIIC